MKKISQEILERNICAKFEENSSKVVTCKAKIYCICINKNCWRKRLKRVMGISIGAHFIVSSLGLDVMVNCFPWSSNFPWRLAKHTGVTIYDTLAHDDQDPWLYHETYCSIVNQMMQTCSKAITWTRRWRRWPLGKLQEWLSTLFTSQPSDIMSPW